VQTLQELNRRAFLKRVGAVSGMGVGAPLALNLAAAGQAAAFTNTDYKALVCIFLGGGNDYANTVVPYDIPNYDRYSSIRGGGPDRTAGGIALGRNELTATALAPQVSQTLTDNLQYALAPKLTRLKALWDAGKCAIQLNVGPLVVPLTLAQYEGGSPVPPKLFSHNDQQSVWQSLAAEGATAGWGGRLADLALAGNVNSSLTCISAGGNAVFLAGNDVVQYQMSINGPRTIYAVNSDQFSGAARAATLRTLMTQNSSNLLERDFAVVTKRALDTQQLVADALAPVVLNTNFHPEGGSNFLADQMQIVARTIGARAALGARRQVFFVQAGGYDHHDHLPSEHPIRMAELNEALGQFQLAMDELGVSNNVTAFTASDFGRTLSSNGDGSDHGWGGHHFVVGGAVQGGRFFGTAPHVSVTSDDQVGQGRLLPSTAVDQYAATLARWFGASATEVSALLPNLGNFATANLGFLS
jgi:uncharacterized protein (DUF1501 family)